MMVAGGLAIYNLPISQYPPIAPPSIAIDAFYPGASAETVENSVTQIIEQKMTGLDDMLYISGTSDSSGASRIELTFAPGTDPDLAWAKVQNKLQLAMASLPDVVQRSGVKVSKSTRNYLIIVGLISEDGSMDGNDLRDYAQSNLEKVLARVPGVGEVENFGSQYAMRVWLNPDKLTDYRLTMEDVILALRAYNVEVSAGQFGGAPAVEGPAPERLHHRPESAPDPGGVRRHPPPHQSGRLRGADQGCRPDGTGDRALRYRWPITTANLPPPWPSGRRPAPMRWIRPMPSRRRLEEMSRYFPPGMKVVYPYDTTPFAKVAIDEVVKTLFEAIAAGLSGHVAVHGKHPGHADSDHRGAGGAAGHLRACWGCSGSPSTC